MTFYVFIFRISEYYLTYHPFYLLPTGQSDRKVPEQPLYFTDSEGNITRYNLRKLSEMPYHLLRAHRIDDLYSEVFFNFRFLHAKLSCMPLQVRTIHYIT